MVCDTDSIFCYTVLHSLRAIHCCHYYHIFMYLLPFHSNALERMVEDLIQESMKRGDFNDLPGQGKPLTYSEHNPFVDTTTHNLNKILVNNGFAPEWIMLQSDIRCVCAFCVCVCVCVCVCALCVYVLCV